MGKSLSDAYQLLPLEEGSMSPNQGTNNAWKGSRLRSHAALVACTLCGLLVGLSLGRPSTPAAPSPPEPAPLDNFSLDVLAGGRTWNAAMQEVPQAPYPQSLCVFSRTYAEQLAYLPLHLLALYNTGFPNLKVYVINTEEDGQEEIQSAVTMVNALIGLEDFSEVLPIPITLTGDYGFGASDDALRLLYSGNLSSSCDYSMFTNGDNIYSKGFGKMFTEAFRLKADLIGWDFVTHHGHHGGGLSRAGKLVSEDPGDFKTFHTLFQVNSIDLGAAMFRTEVARHHQVLFAYAHGMGSRYIYESDGWFIEKLERYSQRTHLIHAALLLHQ